MKTSIDIQISDKSLEEAADEYASDSTGFIDMTAYNAFIAGAEWQKSQMLKDTVEADAEVCKLTERVWITPIDGKKFHQDVYDNFKAGDKVRIVIVKSEEESK